MTPPTDPLRAMIERLRMDLDVAATWLNDADRGVASDGTPMTDADRAKCWDVGESMVCKAVNRAKHALRKAPLSAAA